MPEYAPLNRHEQLRRELWNGVYLEYVLRDPDPATEADKALAEFDERFKHPKGGKGGYIPRY